MKKIFFIICVAVLTFSCKDKTNKTTETATNSTTTEENQDGWTVLFDGTNLDQWKGYGEDSPRAEWKIEGDALVFHPPTDRVKGANYNLITKKEFTNFILTMDWKISEGGNSGIFWGINDDGKYGQPYETGPEIQVLDNEKHPDGKNGPDRHAGALYDMVAPSKDVTKPVGEWNSCVISINYKTNKGSSTLNGVTIAEFPLHGPEWDALLANSKFSNWDGFAKFKTGKIGVQDHGNIVSFRNIKIKEL
ncbi:DUF1080 domain-containing protein [Cellulophaga sp. F20128]|uniref:3-keto-disaccharide hydrolase n=1 Tax=Cellulophaga sp. F20128 TaxID=2926413 RepID=UPI001FF25863|nr:DUF1080 domain-containing protein [Cellulophaga sp. F20128]MCK0155731.1 DUF1080 domain-containing protein [Cellulophaga sp. F20128]